MMNPFFTKKIRILFKKYDKDVRIIHALYKVYDAVNTGNNLSQEERLVALAFAYKMLDDNNK